MNPFFQIISKVKWQLHTEDLLRGLSVFGVMAIWLHYYFPNVIWTWALSFVVASAWSFWKGFFSTKHQQAIRLVHQKIDNTEYSLDLLAKNELNIAEQLQLNRLLEKGNIQTPWVFTHHLWYYLGAVAASILLTVLFDQSFVQKLSEKSLTEIVSGKKDTPAIPPQFEKALLTVVPPAYTGLKTVQSEQLNASAIVGSNLTWQLSFSHQDQLKVKLSNARGVELPFTLKENKYVYQDQLLSSGLYAIKAYWKDSLIYASDYYRLEALPDVAPKIEPSSKELYSFHYLKDSKTVQLNAKVSDDFMVNEVYMIATLARGSGENVKFREVKMPITQKAFKSSQLSKSIDLKALNFTPGDELYYYWAAIDNRRPKPNFTKSDTYFIVYKDTTKAEESDLATMAMNIMPEYFRSQRQIIIDTEKLIAKRKKITDKEFKSASNEIGFDQKTLRLRYGQYLGEEFENSIGGGNPLPDNADKDGDILKGFRHAHDEGEHDHDQAEKHEEEHHHHEQSNDDNKDPLASMLADYVHSHDDGEANTFYEQSTRSLLKSSLEQMWQSELHLRMYEPEKALPYEKKALEFLKAAQHKARTFAKKTSFDPPPIKEKEKRLSGELTKFNAKFSYAKNLSQAQLTALAAEVMGYLQEEKSLNGLQKQKVLTLSMALSQKVLNTGMDQWSILSDLQKLASGKVLDSIQAKRLNTRIFALLNTDLPKPSSATPQGNVSEKRLEKSFFKNWANN
ncbi:hypothetical protein GOQ04_24215 [Emticicia sp. ODNR4P]|nr:hypothetical protein [Emticicia sp. ODNR4P]